MAKMAQNMPNASNKVIITFTTKLRLMDRSFDREVMVQSCMDSLLDGLVVDAMNRVDWKGRCLSMFRRIYSIDRHKCNARDVSFFVPEQQDWDA